MTGQELKAARYKLGLSLADVARLLNVSARSIARWESSKEQVEIWKQLLYKTLKKTN